MRVLASRLGATCFGFSLLCAGWAHAERILLDKPLTQFSGDALGGVRTIVQYDTAVPNRHDTAILFLAAPDRPGDLPTKIQVLNANGVEQPDLIDSEGADCTLEHVALFRTGKDVAALVATRVFDTASFSQADPGPMEIQTYQLEVDGDGDAGRSAIVFKAQGTPTRSKPLCAIEDVNNALDAAAKVWRPTAVTP
jgi:hypothetical protein